ncbi:LamG-like jellyroll fold domain-containing protein [Rubritalea marina]|uniref:LamG-like jellyroll fold domain-containing protein n=1 Tax=Rubritalea marina TaxID=361055 RepID=UPI0014615E6A|nr:LamG-like jellyroll fold domain-containing protein [Rubritalea marina]
MDRVIIWCFALLVSGVLAGEKTDTDYPLGMIGGRYFAQSESNMVRVSEVIDGAPGALAGLQVDDYIYGAFGEEFSDSVRENSWGIFIGATRDLGEAIERAQRGDGLLPLMVLRSGVGTTVVNVQLEGDGGLGPTFPLGSTAFEAQYEIACAGIHESIMNDESATGSNYPKRWAGFALLGHPNWNDTTGDTPYRLSINKVRDSCLSALENAQYAPLEQYLPDGTANPHFVNQFAGHENWVLNTSLMFLAEYLEKTKEEEYYDELQTYSEKIANRVQWWAQYGGRHPIAGGAHAGVHSDYTGNGFNICVVHSFSALSMAKKVTDAEGERVLDTSVRIRDARHYGYASEDEKPDSVKGVVPEGWDEAVDPSIEEKMAWQWEQLKASMHEGVGAVAYTYGFNESFSLDASARTAGAIFGYMNSLEGADPPAADKEYVDQMTDYLVRFQEHFQYAHTHTLGGVAMHQLAMPYWTAQQRRYLLDQWKWYWHLAWQPGGERQEYIRGWIENDDDSNFLLGEIFTALPYSVARGGYATLPGWDTSEWVVDFSATPHELFEPEYHTLVSEDGTLDVLLDVLDGLGESVPTDDYTVSWTVLSENAASVQLDDASSLSTGFDFSQDGIYDLELRLQGSGQELVELLKVHVHAWAAPDGYQAGVVESEFHYEFNSTPLTAISGRADRIRRYYSLDFPPEADTMGREVEFKVVPKESGLYQFYLTTNDGAEIHWDPEDDSSWELIAASSAVVERKDWEAISDQSPVAVNLTAGEVYTFRLFHKTGKTPGYVSVGWTTPSESDIHLVDGSVLVLEEPEAAVTPAITTNLSDQSPNVGSYASFNFLISGSGTKIYQWYRNGEPIGPVTEDHWLWLWPVVGGSQGTYYCVCTVGEHVFVSDTATLTVPDNTGSVAGGIWVATFEEIEGSDVEDLEANYHFPWNATGGYQTITDFELYTPSQTTNSIGHRASGWVVPPTSGKYRFYVTGDDDVDFYWSPTEYDTHMQLVAHTTGSTGEKSWSDGRAGVSEYFDLVAGERYYIELRHKENKGASHFAVAWQKEGEDEPINGEGAISGDHLEYRHGGYHSHGVVPAPIPFDDTLVVAQDVPALIDVTENDAFAGSVEVVAIPTAPSLGYARISSDGKSISYTKQSSGSVDSLEYTIRQSDGQTGSATLAFSEVDALADDLLAHWTFDAEEADGSFLDSSGNAYHMTTSDEVELSSVAKRGSSIYINGDTLTIPPALTSGFGESVSISFWAQRDGAEAFRSSQLFHAQNASNQAVLRLYVPNNSAATIFELGSEGTVDKMTTSFDGDQSLFNDVWSHWVFTKDSSAGLMQVYKDGALVGARSNSTTPFNVSVAQFVFGSSTSGGNSYAGYIDELRIHSRVLSETEIALLAEKESKGGLNHWVRTYLDESLHDDPEKGGVHGDASENGVQNGLYYAFGLGNPNLAQAPSLDADSKSHGLPVGKMLSGTFRYSYIEPKEAVGITLVPQVSTDMIEWRPFTDPSVSGSISNASMEDVDSDYTMHHVEFTPQGTPLFFRVEAIESP